MEQVFQADVNGCSAQLVAAAGVHKTRNLKILYKLRWRSGSSVDIVVPMGWQAAIVSLSAATITGTSPTFNVVVQKRLRQAATTDLVGTDVTGTAIYDDTLAFGQVTSTAAVRIASLCTGPQTPTANSSVVTTADWLQSDGVLTAGDVRVGPMGPTWRVKWVVAGTSPSGTFSVTAQLIPFGT